MGRTAAEVACDLQRAFVEAVLAQLAAATIVRLDFAAAQHAAVRSVLREEDFVDLLVIGEGVPLSEVVRARLQWVLTRDPLVACALVEAQVGYIAACLPCPYRGPRAFTCGYPFFKSTLPTLSSGDG